MSDMMRQGAPPSTPGMGGSTLSPANGADAALMQSRGINEDMPIKDYIETTFKVPITAPVKALKVAVQNAAKNASVPGKMQGMAPRPQMPRGGNQRPMGQSMASQTPSAPAQGQSRGMNDLIGRLG